MAFPFAIVPRPWRALHRALGICGLTLVAGSATVLAPAAAAAAPTATTAVAKGKKASKTSKAKKSSKTTRAGKASRASRGSRTAKAHRATRAATRHHAARSAHRERAAPAAAPTAESVSVPQVVIPEVALATSATPGTGNPFTLITRSATSLLDGLVARARGQLGTRYVYGATDPDNALDCSSFARYVMEALGVRLPRTANQQARIGAPVPRDLTALRPGDLLTFGSRRHTSHVGIYLGQGRFIHASVKNGQVIETTIDRNRSLFRRWQGARRLLAGVVDSLPGTAPAATDELGTHTSGG